MNKNTVTRVIYYEGLDSIMVYPAGEYSYGWVSLVATNSPDGFCGCREFTNTHCCRHLRLAQAHYIAAVRAYGRFVISRECSRRQKYVNPDDICQDDYEYITMTGRYTLAHRQPELHTVYCSVCGYEMQTTEPPTQTVRCGACFLEQAHDSAPYIEANRHDLRYSPITGESYEHIDARPVCNASRL